MKLDLYITCIYIHVCKIQMFIYEKFEPIYLESFLDSLDLYRYISNYEIVRYTVNILYAFFNVLTALKRNIFNSNFTCKETWFSS